MVDGKIEMIKVSVSVTASAFISLLGAEKKYVIVLLILMVTDIVFGWLKGLKLHHFNLSTAKWGLVGKIAVLVIVYILGRLDWAFDLKGFLVNAGVLYYVIVEMASIVENINDGGLATLPGGLVELTRRLKTSAGKAILAKIKQMITTAIGLDIDSSSTQEKEPD